MQSLDLTSFVIHIGYIGLFLTIAIESGLLIGVFLPGDTLLMAIGALGAVGEINIWIAIIYCSTGAILGNLLGYYIGRKYGERVFSSDKNYFFKKSHIAKIQRFFDRYGKISVFLSRFVPVVRTGLPTLAGVAKMKYSSFIAQSILGGIFWTFSIIFITYKLGNLIPNLDHYISLVFIFIVAIGILPFVGKQARKLFKRT